MAIEPHVHEQHVPRAAIIAAAVLIVFTIGVAAIARHQRELTPTNATPPVASVSLRFEDRPDGSVGVLDGATSREVAVVAPGSNGFVRGVLRGMFRTRRLESIDLHEPFVLTREADGRLMLTDPRSGRAVELRSFGTTNYDTFAGLLATAREAG